MSSWLRLIKPPSGAIPERFVNFLMVDGKKSKASKIFYTTLNLLYGRRGLLMVRNRIGVTPPTVCHLLQKAVDRVKPRLEVRKVRVGGKSYQVPASISKRRREGLAIRWILESAQHRLRASTHQRIPNQPRRGLPHSLAEELLDAYKGEGGARQRRDELHRLAALHRNSIRYRRW